MYVGIYLRRGVFAVIIFCRFVKPRKQVMPYVNKLIDPSSG